MATYNIGVFEPNREISAASNDVPRGFYGATSLSVVDSDLVASNIKEGASIFGIAGIVSSTGTNYTLPETGQTMQYVPYDNATYVPSTSLRSFTDNGDGTVTDNGTGLMWIKDTDAAGLGATMTWSAGVTTAYGLSYAGHTGWRLPNFRELESIVKYANSDSDTSGYASPLFAGSMGELWSSTIPPTASSTAVTTTFSGSPWFFGRTRILPRTGYNFIRPCRNAS